MSDSPKKISATRWLAILLVLVGVVCIGYYLFRASSVPKGPPALAASSESEQASSEPRPEPESTPESSWPEDITTLFPEGKLFITNDRAAYQDSSMRLSIPKLELENLPVLGDVAEETLERGIGLYDYAQLPGTGNRNVSIAGHRDVFGQEFYDLDKLVEGDEMLLTYEGKEYRYTFKDAKVVEADDWTPIHIQGFSCLTLTTCTPIGVASHRIIVRAELTEIVELPATSASSAA